MTSRCRIVAKKMDFGDGWKAGWEIVVKRRKESGNRAHGVRLGKRNLTQEATRKLLNQGVAGVVV